MSVLPDLSRLHRLIEEQAALLQDFVGLLEQEESLLVSGQTDALMTLADQKTRIYRRLQLLHDDQMRALACRSAEALQGEMERAIQKLPAAQARWRQLLELATEARRRNQLNGQLIAERMKHNQAALSVLLAAADAPQLYGPDGSARPTARGRILGSG